MLRFLYQSIIAKLLPFGFLQESRPLFVPVNALFACSRPNSMYVTCVHTFWFLTKETCLIQPWFLSYLPLYGLTPINGHHGQIFVPLWCPDQQSASVLVLKFLQSDTLNYIK